MKENGVKSRNFVVPNSSDESLFINQGFGINKVYD